MDKGTILKVTSALVGLALVLFGGWLTMSEEAAHSELLIWAGLGLIGGGLGTAALPSAIPGRPPTAPPPEGPRSRPRRGTTPPLAVLLALAMVMGLSSGCAQTTAAIAAAPKVRDVTAIALRLTCRVADRTSRATGGPWVVPRSDDERVEDARAGWFGEVTGVTSGGETPNVSPPDQAPPVSEPTPETGPPEPVAPTSAPPVPPPEA